MMQRIAIDGGQTGTRVRLPDGELVKVGPIRTDRPVVAQIAGYLHAISARLTPGVDYQLAVGVSGLTPAYTKPAELLAAAAELGVVAVALAHDSISAYLGANGLAFGAVVAVGTGVVGLGVSATTVTRVDGWGYLFGDAGSAYWIGRAGVDAALRSFDGRGRHTDLEQSAAQRFGPLPELYVSLQSDVNRVSRIASYAVTVADAADAGDAVAKQIIADAADQLATTACAAATAQHPTWSVPPRISWTGTVLTANATLRDRFIAGVRRRIPDADVAAPLGDPLDGVARLFDLPAEHPLVAEVSRAGEGFVTP